MKLAVFGATGLTGGFVLSQALEQGHEVTALVRDPSRLSLSHPRLTVLGGSPTAPGDVDRCVRDADAVIHCLGIGLSITAASTARFLLQQVTSSEWVRSAPSISN